MNRYAVEEFVVRLVLRKLFSKGGAHDFSAAILMGVAFIMTESGLVGGIGPERKYSDQSGSKTAPVDFVLMRSGCCPEQVVAGYRRWQY